MGGYVIGALPMGISQTLFDAIQSIEAELNTPGEFGEVLRQEIASLVQRMKEVQRKLDAELTEIDTSDEE
jgi:prefoldin subunit 5